MRSRQSRDAYSLLHRIPDTWNKQVEWLLGSTRLPIRNKFEDGCEHIENGWIKMFYSKVQNRKNYCTQGIEGLQKRYLDAESRPGNFDKHTCAHSVTAYPSPVETSDFCESCYARSEALEFLVRGYDHAAVHSVLWRRVSLTYWEGGTGPCTISR